MSTPTPLRAETFLRELQGAVSSRRLYASDHPRNVEIMDKLEAHVAALTMTRPEFSALSDADRLITDGIDLWSRHPQNVGLGVALVGAALVGRSAFTLLLAGLFWMLFRIYLPMEETFLRRTFGDAYQRYRAETSPYFAPPKKLS